jgi:hypothetical protein
MEAMPEPSCFFRTYCRFAGSNLKLLGDAAKQIPEDVHRRSILRQAIGSQSCREVAAHGLN